MLNKQFACMLGVSIAEWFDYIIFILIAKTINQLFFPQLAGSGQSYLVVFSVFAIGFCARPLGGWLITRYFQSNKALLLTAMGFGACGILASALPTYASVGWLAGCLLLAIRLAQGMFIGAEFPSLIAASLKNKKSKMVGPLVNCSPAMGVFIGTIFVSSISQRISDAEMLSWGWRIMFFSSGCLSLLMFFLRKSILDYGFKNNNSEEEERSSLKSFFKIFLFCASSGMSFYVYNIFFVHSLNQTNPNIAPYVPIFLISAIMIGGYICRNLGNIKTALIGTVVMAVSVYPCFYALESRNFIIFLLPFAFGLAISMGALPKYIFNSARGVSKNIAMPYNLCLAVFGAPAISLCEYFIKLGDKHFPALLLIFLCLLSCSSLIIFKDKGEEE